MKFLDYSAMKDLLITLIGDPVKSKVLEKTSKFLKYIDAGKEHESKSMPPSRGFSSRRGRAAGFRGRRGRPYPPRGAGRGVNYGSCFFCGSPEHFISYCQEFNALKDNRNHHTS